MVDFEDASDHLVTDLTKDLTLKWRLVTTFRYVLCYLYLYTYFMYSSNNDWGRMSINFYVLVK